MWKSLLHVFLLWDSRCWFVCFKNLKKAETAHLCGSKETRSKFANLKSISRPAFSAGAQNNCHASFAILFLSSVGGYQSLAIHYKVIHEAETFWTFSNIWLSILKDRQFFQRLLESFWRGSRTEKSAATTSAQNKIFRIAFYQKCTSRSENSLL